MSESDTQPSELPKLAHEDSAPNERRWKPGMLHRHTIPSVTGHEDSGAKMWSAYLVEAEKHDQRISDGWKDDANGLLIFAGLLSVTVGAFVIEGYKKLSPDPGEQTTFLLGQISQQLAGLASNEFVQPVPFSATSPTTPIILVNCMWLLSLVLGICAALSATLMQEWARRFIQLPQIPSGQAQRARVRSYLFLGIQKYHMHHAVEMTPTLLHLSVFLFFAGLMIFIFVSHQTVAIALSISVGLFSLAYFALTVLPCFRLDCPYRTPMTSICWFLFHTLLCFEAFFRRFLLRRLHNWLVPYNLGDIKTFKQRKLTEWLDISDNALSKHGQRLKDGFTKSIVQGALDAPVGVDLNALAWMFELPALADKRKVQNFLAGIPGETVVQLMNSSVGARHSHFRDHLYTLLRSCASPAAGLDEKVRKSRLLTCLNAIHHVARASVTIPNGVTPSVDVLSDLRTNFANMGLMRILWADNDPAVRVTARSICAFLARHFLRKYPLMDSELAWLQDVMGQSSHIIFRSLNDLPTVDSMNIDSFVYGALSYQTNDLPIKPAILFVETLTILKSAGSQITLQRDTFEEWISGFIGRAEEQGIRRRREVVGELRKIAEDVFPDSVQELELRVTIT